MRRIVRQAIVAKLNRHGGAKPDLWQGLESGTFAEHYLRFNRPFIPGDVDIREVNEAPRTARRVSGEP
jgi:hypothetical protein